MSYQIGSISSLLSDGSEVSLSSIFTESSKQLFARSFKPEEFPKLKIEKKVIEDESSKKKRKKEKTKKILNDTPLDGDNVKNEVEIVTLPDANMKGSTTLFVGNIPITENVRSITKLFQEFGGIESVRLRSVPVAGTKVDDAGNQNLVKKVCVNALKFGDQKGSFNAYIVFSNDEAATNALQLNNRLVGGRHLRVDRSTPTLFDSNRTVFLGNLPHYADEEELREYFANVSLM
jgi:RNA recognition motif-containing protein